MFVKLHYEAAFLQIKKTVVWVVELLPPVVYSRQMALTDELIGKLVSGALMVLVVGVGYYFIKDYFVSGERNTQNSAVIEAKVGADAALDEAKAEDAKRQAAAVEQRRQQDAARAVRTEAAIKELNAKLEKYAQFQDGRCVIPADLVDWMRGRRSIRSLPAAGGPAAQSRIDSLNK